MATPLRKPNGQFAGSIAGAKAPSLPPAVPSPVGVSVEEVERPRFPTRPDPEAMWRARLADMDRKERLALAEQWDVQDVPLLRALADDEAWQVRSCVARQPHTPTDVLDALSQDIEWDVCDGVARNPAATLDQLVRLSSSKSADIRGAVAEHPATPPEVLDRLADDPRLNVRVRADENPHTPAETLWRRKEEGDWNEALALASNPNCPADLVATIAATVGFEDAQRKAVAHPNLPERYIRQFGDPQRGWWENEWAAKNPSAPADMLTELADHSNAHVRVAVAGNPNTPNDVLVKLAQVDGRFTAVAVAENRGANGDTLRAVEYDQPIPLVQEKVARHPNVPLDVLGRLSRDEAPEVRVAARKNPRFADLPEEVQVESVLLN